MISVRRSTTLIVVVILGWALGACSSPRTSPPSSTGGSEDRQGAGASIRDVAGRAVQALHDRDFDRLAGLAHPERGVTFSPYAHVDPEKDVTLSPQVLARAWESSKVRVWGHQDGSGQPIRGTFREYFERWVYDRDYASAPRTAVGKRLGRGNTLDNLSEVWPDGTFVEFHFPGSEEFSGMDWRSLRLVFVPQDDSWALVGVVHDEWTI